LPRAATGWGGIKFKLIEEINKAHKLIPIGTIIDRFCRFVNRFLNEIKKNINKTIIGYEKSWLRRIHGN
jgi:hypothetical protein